MKSPVLDCQKPCDRTLLSAQVECLAAVGRRLECHFHPHGVRIPLFGDISCLFAFAELAQQDEGVQQDGLDIVYAHPQRVDVGDELDDFSVRVAFFPEWYVLSQAFKQNPSSGIDEFG